MKCEPTSLRQKVKPGSPVNQRVATGRGIFAEECGNRFSREQIRLPLRPEGPVEVFACIKSHVGIIKGSSEFLARDMLLIVVVM